MASEQAPSMTEILGNVENQLKTDPLPQAPVPSSVEKFIPSKYRSGSTDTLEQIKNDARKTIADLENICRRLDEYRTHLKGLLG